MTGVVAALGILLLVWYVAYQVVVLVERTKSGRMMAKIAEFLTCGAESERVREEFLRPGFVPHGMYGGTLVETVYHEHVHAAEKCLREDDIEGVRLHALRAFQFLPDNERIRNRFYDAAVR